MAQPFEARRSQVSSRCWTWSARIWVDNPGVWFGSDQRVSMPRFFSLKKIKCTVHFYVMGATAKGLWTFKETLNI